MTIRPYRPLLLPAALIVTIVLLATFLPLFSKIDETLIAVVQSAPDGLEQPLNVITHLGDHWVLVGVAVVVASWESLRRRPVRGLVMLLSLLTLPLFYLVKETVQRARPISEFVTQQGLHDYSFPSGHSTGSAAIYGMIALLAYSHMKGIWKYTITGLCVLIIALIGFSRVYIGAHFPTDVLGGWLVALVVISLLRSLSLYLAKKSDKSNQQAIKDTTDETS